MSDYNERDLIQQIHAKLNKNKSSHLIENEISAW